MSQIFLKDSFVPRFVRMHFSIKKKKQCFLFKAFFLASGNHHLNYREVVLKLLLLLLATISFDFSDITVNENSFFRLDETHS